MDSIRKLAPAITINGKEHCINIGKDVIRALGYPPYICILEHDEWQVIAITECDESEPLSFGVPEGFPQNRMKKFRIYSQSFVNELLQNCDLDIGEKYSFKGEYIAAMNAVLFNLEAAGQEEL